MRMNNRNLKERYRSGLEQRGYTIVEESESKEESENIEKSESIEESESEKDSSIDQNNYQMAYL